MPLFSRPDGDRIPDVSPERRIMPFLMRGRNESAVYHEQTYEIGKARRWLREFNRSNPPQAATLFHLFLWACSQGLHRHPRMNRFVSGSRLYQRRGVQVSFAAKKELSATAPIVTVKKSFADGEPFAAAVADMAGLIGEGRSGRERRVDRELKLALLLPAFLLRIVLWFLRGLDRLNLLPRSMIESDPLYASLFVANLGSIGLDNTFHHLYEYGTVSIFAVLGTQKKALVLGRDGSPEVREVVQIRWTLDERIIDGYYAGEGMRFVQKVMEDPERYLGPAAEVAAGRPPALASGAEVVRISERATGGGS
ncbi:MAG TPA: 2-oxo acid dehydrogenase subunit E2 [Kofleriaceae bacterium]|nr:2-oxo acid dehydrogenase subunit E2 [Kofleriaceae bacterium]